jgi:purine-binding chemotaxis protein CheW
MVLVPTADILPAPLGSDAAAEHLDGVVAGGKDRKEPLHLLSLPKLLQSTRQRVVTR